jgi:hypothetical protein
MQTIGFCIQDRIVWTGKRKSPLTGSTTTEAAGHGEEYAEVRWDFIFRTPASATRRRRVSCTHCSTFYFMKTDTPRTEMETLWANADGGERFEATDAEFARELERENARLREEISAELDAAVNAAVLGHDIHHLQVMQSLRDRIGLILSSASRQPSLPADGSTSTKSVAG